MKKLCKPIKARKSNVSCYALEYLGFAARGLTSVSWGGGAYQEMSKAIRKGVDSYAPG
jgi:hypothetical protein